MKAGDPSPERAVAYVCGCILAVGYVVAGLSMWASKRVGAVCYPVPASLMAVTGSLWVALTLVSGDLVVVSDPAAVARCKAVVACTYLSEAAWCLSVLHMLNQVGKAVPSESSMDRQCARTTAVLLMLGWVVAVAVDGFERPSAEAACVVRPGYRALLLCVIIAHAALFYMSAQAAKRASSYYRPLISVMRVLVLVVFALATVGVVMMTSPDGDDAAFQSTLALSAAIVVSVFLASLSGNTIASCQFCGRVSADDRMMQVAARKVLETFPAGRRATGFLRSIAPEEGDEARAGEAQLLDTVLTVGDVGTSLLDQDDDLVHIDTMRMALAIPAIREMFLAHRGPTPAKIWLHCAMVLQARALDLASRRPASYVEVSMHCLEVARLLNEGRALAVSTSAAYFNTAEHRALVASLVPGRAVNGRQSVLRSLPAVGAASRANLERLMRDKRGTEVSPFQGSLDLAFSRCAWLYTLLCLPCLCGPRRPAQKRSRNPRVFPYWTRSALVGRAKEVLGAIATPGSAALEGLMASYKELREVGSGVAETKAGEDQTQTTEPGESGMTSVPIAPGEDGEDGDEFGDTGPGDDGSETKSEAGSGARSETSSTGLPMVVAEAGDDADIHPDVLYTESLVPPSLLPPRLLKAALVSSGGMASSSLRTYTSLYNDLALATAFEIVDVQWRAYDQEAERVLEYQTFPDTWAQFVPHDSPGVLDPVISVLCAQMAAVEWASFVGSQKEYVRVILRRAMSTMHAANTLRDMRRQTADLAPPGEEAASEPTV